MVTATQSTQAPVQEQYAFKFHVLLVHRRTEEEQLLTIHSNSDNFSHVMDLVDQQRPSKAWGVFEILDTPF